MIERDADHFARHAFEHLARDDAGAPPARHLREDDHVACAMRRNDGPEVHQALPQIDGVVDLRRRDEAVSGECVTDGLVQIALSPDETGERRCFGDAFPLRVGATPGEHEQHLGGLVTLGVVQDVLHDPLDVRGVVLVFRRLIRHPGAGDEEDDGVRGFITVMRHDTSPCGEVGMAWIPQWEG